MKKILMISLALLLLTGNVYAESDRPPYEAFLIDNLKAGESYTFGAKFRNTRGGIEVTEVIPGTIAALAAFKPDDVLVQIGSQKSGLTADRVESIFKKESGGMNWGYVYVKVIREGKSSQGILPLSQKRRTPSGVVYELPGHGDMFVYISQLNAAQAALGDQFANAPDNRDFDRAVRFTAAAFDKMAGMYRLISTENVPQKLADRQAEVIASIETFGIMVRNLPPERQAAEAIFTRGYTEMMSKISAWATLIKTYNEYYKQEKRQRGEQ